MRKRLYLLSVLLLMVCGQTWAEKITLTAEDFSVTKDGDWVYDKTEKRVKVELINPEYEMPGASDMEIYYNNDKMVKPINPGTYQVYIDIEETEKYAAVTLTSEAWKFDITMPTFVEGGLKFEVTSLDPKTVKVIANDYTGSSFTIPATVSYLEDDYAVTAIGENAFAGVGSQNYPADLLLPADWEGTKPAATATLWYGGYFVDYRAATIAAVKAASNEAENSIEEAATGFVGIEGVKQAKANAASALANAQVTADNTISAAVDMIAIANAKDAAISAIHMATNEALAAIDAAIVSFKKAAKNELEDKKTEVNDRMNKKAMGYEAIEEVQKAKEQGNEKVMLAADAAKIYIDHATNESTIQNEKQNGLNAMEEETLKTLAGIQAAIAGYKERMKNNINDIAMNAKNTINALGVYYTVKDQAKNEIDKAVATAEASINNADSEEQVNDAKNNALNEIDKQLAYVQDYYNKLQAAKQAANVDVDKAADDAEVAINQAAEGYGNVETVQHAVVTYQTQLRSVKDNAQLTINAEENLDGVGQLKENTIQQIKNMQNKAEEDIQIAIANFKGSVKNEVDNAATATKSEIDAFAVSAKVKDDAKSEIDKAVAAAEASINNADSEEQVNDAKNDAQNKINQQLAYVQDYYNKLQAAIAAVKAAQDVANEGIDLVAEGYEHVNIVQEQITNAKFDLKEIEYNAINAINNATDEDAVNAAKDTAIVEINKTKETYKNYIQIAIANFKGSVKNEVDNAATATKSEIDAFAVSAKVKDDAITEIHNAVAEAEESINNADSEEQVNDAKNDALNKINQQLASVQDYYNKLQAAKADVLAAINKAVDDAEAAINEAADGYDFVEAIQEIITGAKADFEAVKSEASNIISKKNNLNEVKEKEEEFIHEIEDIQVEAVKNIQTEIQPYTSLKENAIAEINAAIDGFTNTEVRAIADKAKTDISNATSEEQINSIKTFAISKIDAIAEILSASQGIKNAELNAWIDAAINDIKSGNQNATPSIDKIKDQILYIINLFQNGKAEGLEEGKAAGKAEAFGTMGEKQNGPAVIVTDQDDKQIILYSPKKVQYIKVSDK